MKQSLCLFECMQAGKRSRLTVRVMDGRPISHHHHPPQRKSASHRSCHPGNSRPVNAAAPGPPGSLQPRVPGRESWGPRGGCQRRSHHDAAQTARGRGQALTGGKSGRVRRRRLEVELQRQVILSITELRGERQDNRTKQNSTYSQVGATGSAGSPEH